MQASIGVSSLMCCSWGMPVCLLVVLMMRQVCFAFCCSIRQNTSDTYWQSMELTRPESLNLLDNLYESGQSGQSVPLKIIELHNIFHN